MCGLVAGKRGIGTGGVDEVIEWIVAAPELRGKYRGRTWPADDQGFLQVLLEVVHELAYGVRGQALSRDLQVHERVVLLYQVAHRRMLGRRDAHLRRAVCVQHHAAALLEGVELLQHRQRDDPESRQDDDPVFLGGDCHLPVTDGTAKHQVLGHEIEVDLVFQEHLGQGIDLGILCRSFGIEGGKVT